MLQSNSASSKSTVFSGGQTAHAGKLIIRPMEERDREEIRAVLQYEHKQTIFRNQPFSDWKYDRHVNEVLSKPPRIVCRVAEIQARVKDDAQIAVDL